MIFRNFLGTTVVALVLLTGCTDDDIMNDEQGTKDVSITTQAELIARYAGTEFISVEDLEIGETADGSTATGKWLVSFTADVVSWSYSDVVEVGTYSLSDEGAAIANFGNRDLEFTGDEGSIELESQTYVEISTAAFDSQDTLTSFLDNSSYVSIERQNQDESPSNSSIRGDSAVSFNGAEFTLISQDTAQAGTYRYVNESSLELGFSDRETTVYFLTGDRLLIDNVEYVRDTSAQIDSQESLGAYLDGSSYRSVTLQSVGETSDGSEAAGYWFLTFTGDTFNWSYEDIQETGNYRFIDEGSFTSVLGDRELVVQLEGGDIFWEEVRYSRQ